MTERISFAIENAEMIREDPNSSFALLSLDFFASGDNLNNMYVSEENLLRTSDTIRNCPLVWKYDPILDDVHTHDKNEVPCGFVPESAEIKSRVLSDGRTMLSTIAYVWKRYSGDILKFFKRDKGQKPVSVEMSLLKAKQLPTGRIELLDFKYEAITVLGTYVTPAVPLANASVLSFSQIKDEYEKAVHLEFDEDLKIPTAVKENSKKGLEFRKRFSSGGTAIASASARYLIDNDFIIPEKLTYFANYFKNGPSGQEDVDPLSENYIPWLMWGGLEGKRWVESTIEKVKAREALKLEVFEKEKVMEKEEEKTPEVEMAKPPFPPEKEEETPAEDKAEGGKEEKPGEKRFAFPKNFSMEMMEKMFAEESEEDIQKAKFECGKGEFADPAVMMAGMFAQMCKMSDAMCKMAEEKQTYMAENEGLRKFKAEIEAKDKMFEVEKTIAELSAKVVIPQDAKDEMKAEAEKFAYWELDSWKTYCKARSFEFAVKGNEKDGVVRVGLPFTGPTSKKKDDLWS